MQIYGFDVSKDRVDVFSKNPDGELAQEIPNSIESLCDFIQSTPEDCLLVAEFTGAYSDKLVYCASMMNRKISLVSGYTIKYSSGNQKGRSDQLAAKMIYEYATRYLDKLELIAPDGEVIAELKEISRTRKLLVEQRKQLLTQRKNQNQRWFHSISVAQAVNRMLEELDKQIQELEDELTYLISHSRQTWANYKLLTSIKGVGKTTAAELIIATGNFQKINSSKKAASYMGVCPFPNRSGNWVGKEKTPYRADKNLKRLLFLCARTACRFNPDFIKYKNRKLEEGKHYHLVMINAANKLLRVIYAMVRDQKAYVGGYVPLDPRIEQKFQ